MLAKKVPRPVDKHVGARIRMRRLVLEMSQEALGMAIDLTFQQVQKYEKGMNRVGASRLQQIANVLKVQPSYFFEGAPGQTAAQSGGEPIPEYISAFLSTNDGVDLVKAMTKIKSPKLRRHIVHLAEHLAGEGK